MKRKLMAGIVTLALGALLVPAAFAARNDNQTSTAPAAPSTQNQQFFNQMFDWHKAWLENAVKNKQLTEEQAKAWAQHFDQMKEFHSKNGFGPMGGMMNMMGNGGMVGSGMGLMMSGGMMGSFNTPSSK